MKLFLPILKNIVEGIFWVTIFLSPFLIGTIIAFILYLHGYKILAAVAISIGTISGVVLAEKIRRKYGCSTFMARLISTPDYWPNEADEIDKMDKSS
jgi:hypothetical protein